MTNGPMDSILIVFLIYFFLMGFFCICKCRRSDYRNGGSVNHSRTPRRGRRGLDPVVIETFPTFEYSVVKEHKFGKGALECAVCLNEFQDDETIRLLPKCDHVFHPDCIDVWLSNRTTCPVCRANLVPESGETPATTEPVQNLEGESSQGEIQGSETLDAENRQLSIHVICEEEETPKEVLQTPKGVLLSPQVKHLVQNQMQNWPSRLPRSHSTGHSLVQPGEDVERFTLRLPADVRRQIMNKRLHRTNSMGELPRVPSSRRGYRTTGERSIRGGRFMKPEGWMFSMTPPFFMRRASSPWSPKMTAERDATVTPSPPPGKLSPLRWSSKSDGTAQSSTRPPV